MMSILPLGVETMPPLLMAARFLVAGTILFPISLFSRSSPGAPESAPSLVARRKLLAPQSSRRRRPSTRGGRLRWPSRKEWIGAGVIGVLLLVANGVVGVGEKSVPSGLAALLIATMPLCLLSSDAGLNHARLDLAPLAGLLLGLAGVALLSGLGDRGAHHPGRGRDVGARHDHGPPGHPPVERGPGQRDGDAGGRGRSRPTASRSGRCPPPPSRPTPTSTR